MRFVTLPPPDDRPTDLTIGAIPENEDAPIALAIAKHGADQNIALLQSIVVSEAHRRRGVALALIAEMERVLRERGANHVHVYRPGRDASVPAVEALAAKCGYARVQGMLRCTGSEKILDAPWMRVELTAGDELFSWTELREEEARAIKAASDYPRELTPFPDEPFEPINSIGLRRGHEVVAWLITHRSAPDEIAYSRLFVRPHRRSSARGVALVAQAIRMQIARGIRRASFQVMTNNLPMMRFVERRAAAYLDAITETRLFSKALKKPLSKAL